MNTIRIQLSRAVIPQPTVAELRADAKREHQALMLQLANTMHEMREAMERAESSNGVAAASTYRELSRTMQQAREALDVFAFESSGH